MRVLRNELRDRDPDCDAITIARNCDERDREPGYAGAA